MYLSFIVNPCTYFEKNVDKYFTFKATERMHI